MQASPDCLSTEAIANYAAGVGSAEEVSTIEHHADRCERCRSDIAAVVRSKRVDSSACVGALAPGALIGRYVVIRALGGGGMGVVYAAHDPELDRQVAIKLVRAETSGDRDAAARLTREARTLALLSHPNIVTAFDAGNFGDEVFIAMELVSGSTLAEWLDQCKRTVGEIVDAFAQAGRGLAAAHVAGLVHRDFKPQNVFVRDDGRVLVGDFGLARKTDVDTPPLAIDGDVHSLAAGTGLTASGALLGTVAYMAPEQLDGDGATALTDQFSFAVALYEALYDERPFAATTVGELRRQFVDAPLPRWAGNEAVPAWLREVLARSLARDPHDRYATMLALVTALTRARRHRRRWIASAALATGLAIAGFVFGASRAGIATPTCATAGSRLAGVWDADRQKAIGAAFMATKRPFASDAWAAARSALDRYTVAWSDAANGACKATRIDGTQSEALLDLRTACLDARLASVAALASVFARADAGVVEHAVEAVAHLPALSACGDTGALLAIVVPPRDPATVAAVAGIRAQLAEARALDAAGNPAAARPIAISASAVALVVGYAPLSADALVARGTIEREIQPGVDQNATLEHAVDLAEAGHDDVVKADAWIELVRLASMLADFKSAHRSAAHATAVLARLAGTHDDLSATLAVAEANAYRSEGEYEKARALLERALSLREAIGGADSPSVAAVIGDLAAVYYNEGRYTESRAANEKALAIRMRTLGPHHPAVAAANNNLALVLIAARDLEGARARLLEARAIDDDVFGATSTQSALVVGNLGKVYYRLGQQREAIEASKHALAVLEPAFGAGHPDVAGLWSLIGQAQFNAGDYPAAQVAFEHALASRSKLGETHVVVLAARLALGALQLARGNARAARVTLESVLVDQSKALGPDHTDVIETRLQLGRALRTLGDLRGALAQFEQALASEARDFGTDNVQLVVDLGEIGVTQLELGDAKDALVALERALALGSGANVDPEERADAQFATARALWATHGDHERALALAKSALATYAEIGATDGSARRSVEGWLARHRR